MFLQNIAYTGYSINIDSAGGSATSMRLSRDGRKLWFVNLTTSLLYEVTLSTPGTLSNGALLESYSASFTSQEAFVYSFDVSDDNRYIYAVGLNNDTVYQYTFNTLGTIRDGITYTGKSLDVNPPEGSPTALDVVDNDHRLLIAGNNAIVYEWVMDVPGDLWNATSTGNTFTIIAQSDHPRCLRFGLNGSKFLSSGSGFDRLFEYDVPDRNQIGSTPVYTGNYFNLPAFIASPVAFEFWDNKKIFVLGDKGLDGEYIFEFEFDPDIPDDSELVATIDTTLALTVSGRMS